MKKFRILSVLVVCLAAMYLFTGCGVSHGSPEGVVKSLVKYYEKGKEKKVLDCYGLDKKGDKESLAEIESTIAYFKAMKSKGITLNSCNVIQEFENYNYVYIYYDVDLGKGKAYPKMDTYITAKKGKKHCVLPAKEVTEEMSTAAASAYTTFMTTDPYKEYLKAYDAFMLKNPSFEEELSIKLN